MESPTSREIQESDKPAFRQLIVAQRRVNLAVLLYFVFLAISEVRLSLGKNHAAYSMLASFELIYFLLLVVFGCFAIYKLGALLGNEQGSGIFYVILMFIPYVGLIALFHLNHKATKVLRYRGIKVGLLGASLDSV